MNGSSMALLDEIYPTSPACHSDRARSESGGILVPRWWPLAVISFVILTLIAPFTPLTSRGYTWAMSQGDDELNALHFNRAEVWFEAAKTARPWRAEPKDKLKLAAATKADLSAGEAFFREHGNTNAAQAITLTKSTSNTPEVTAAKLAKMGFPDLALEALKKSGQPATTQQLLLTAKLELAVSPPQPESALSHLETILTGDPTNQDALEAYAKLKPESQEATRLDLINAIATGKQ